MLIAVEGLIGAGKSTLAKKIQDHLGFKMFEEPVSTNPYLEKFYADAKRWALEMQFWLMTQRFRAHQDAIRHIWKSGQAVVMDRSIYGDMVFAKINADLGNITPEGIQAYMDHFETMRQFLLVPQIVLYLNASPSKCVERILERGRDCERSIPIDYMIRLDRGYKELMGDLERRGSEIIRLDWEEFGDFNDVKAVLEKNGRFATFWHGYNKEAA